MADGKTLGEQRDLTIAEMVRAQLADSPQEETGSPSDGLALSLVAYPPTRTLDYVELRFRYDHRSALCAAWMLGWQARHAQPTEVTPPTERNWRGADLPRPEPGGD